MSQRCGNGDCAVRFEIISQKLCGSCIEKEIQADERKKIIGLLKREWEEGETSPRHRAIAEVHERLWPQKEG